MCFHVTSISNIVWTGIKLRLSSHASVTSTRSVSTARWRRFALAPSSLIFDTNRECDPYVAALPPIKAVHVHVVQKASASAYTRRDAQSKAYARIAPHGRQLRGSSSSVRIDLHVARLRVGHVAKCLSWPSARRLGGHEAFARPRTRRTASHPQERTRGAARGTWYGSLGRSHRRAAEHDARRRTQEAW